MFLGVFWITLISWLSAATRFTFNIWKNPIPSSLFTCLNEVNVRDIVYSETPYHDLRHFILQDSLSTWENSLQKLCGTDFTILSPQRANRWQVHEVPLELVREDRTHWYRCSLTLITSRIVHIEYPVSCPCSRIGSRSGDKELQSAQRSRLRRIYRRWLLPI